MWFILYKVYIVWPTDEGQFDNVALWKKKVVHYWHKYL